MIYDGKKIAELREERKMSQAALARKAGIKQPTLWALEHQVTKQPEARTLLAVANALEVPLRLILKKPTGKMADLESDMIDAFRRLDDINKQAILAAALVLVRRDKK